MPTGQMKKRWRGRKEGGAKWLFKLIFLIFKFSFLGVLQERRVDIEGPGNEWYRGV